MYAILRAKKIKSHGQISKANEHNLRLRTQNNIDVKRSALNKILFNPLEADTKSVADFRGKLSSFYSSLGIQEKKDNVLLYEYVAAASPQFFKNKTSREIEAWANDQVDFMKVEFGSQLKLGILHMDETSPHVHFFVSTELKSIKKYKNRHGVCEKETWSLSSNKYDPEFMSNLQTRFAQANKKHGLKRGVKGSKRRNVPLKIFYDMVERVITANYKSQIEKLIDGIELSLQERLSVATIRGKIREHLSPCLNNFARQQKAAKELAKLDLHRLQVELIADQKKLKLDREDVIEIQVVYSEAINGRLLDIQTNEILMQHNKVLATELEKLGGLEEVSAPAQKLMEYYLKK